MLKSNHCFAVLDSRSDVRARGKAGVYLHDTRHLSEYRWGFGPTTLLNGENAGDWAYLH